MSNILQKEKIILKTWRGNQNGTILLALPQTIIKEYNMEKPGHLTLERQSDGFFIRKLTV